MKEMHKKNFKKNRTNRRRHFEKSRDKNICSRFQSPKIISTFINFDLKHIQIKEI